MKTKKKPNKFIIEHKTQFYLSWQESGSAETLDGAFAALDVFYREQATHDEWRIVKVMKTKTRRG